MKKFISAFLSLMLLSFPSYADIERKVKISSNDTTAGYLNGKLVAGTGISLTEGSDGADETLTIANTGAATLAEAKYITQEASSDLTNEQSLGALTTGILKNTVTGSTGVLSKAAEGTDYYAPSGTDVAVADGGTGASTASGARTNLGVVIGTDVQAYSAITGSIAGLNWQNNSALVGTGAGTVDLITLPSCSNATTEKLLYNNSTHAVTCGTDQDSGAGSGVSDGDKGDITASSSGAVWTIDNLAIGTAKINWPSVINSEIQRAGINWSSLTQDVQAIGINWTSLNQNVQSSGINWSTVTWTGGTLGGTGLAPVILQGSNPTVGTAGFAGVDTTAEDFLVYGASLGVHTPIKAFSVAQPSPTNALDPFLFIAPYALTVTNIACGVDPADSSESAVVDIQECDGTGDNCATVDAAVTCDNDGAADDGSLSNPTIDAGDWVKMDNGTVTGTVSNLVVTVKFKKDRQ